MSETALLIEPILPANVATSKMRLVLLGSRPPLLCRRVTLLILGAYLQTSGVVYITLGADYAYPVYLGNFAPGGPQELVLHADEKPVGLSEFTLNFTNGNFLAGGSLALHTVEY